VSEQGRGCINVNAPRSLYTSLPGLRGRSSEVYSHGVAQKKTRKDADTAGIPLAEVRGKLGDVLDEANGTGAPVPITKRGKVAGGVVSAEDLERLRSIKGERARSTTVVMSYNHAGGASKSSTTRDIGYELAQLGFSVLLIDLDPQANLTSWLGIGATADDRVKVSETIKDTLEMNAPLPTPRHVFGMDLIPSHIDLSETAELLTAKTNGDGRLEVALNKLRETQRYDFVLIDPPPALGKLTTSGARAADFLIVPVPATNKGIEALDGVRRMVNEYSTYNPRLRVAFYLITQLEPGLKHSQEAHDYLMGALGERVAGVIRRRPGLYNDCQLSGEPVGAFRPRDPGREEVQVATRALLKAAGVTVPA